MSPTEFILQTADILEKTAAYLERIDAEKVAARHEEIKKTASKLSDSITAVTGERVPDDLAVKLAGLGPDVQSIISRLTGSGAVESMGGPEITKVASHRGIGPAEESFLSFLLS